VKRLGLLLTAFSPLLPFLISSIPVGAGISLPSNTAYIDSLNFTRVQKHLQFFSSLETRATGYPGNLLAAKYIKDRFDEYRLENVAFENFTVPVPVDHGANLTLLQTSQTIRIYPIEPNLVCPSTTPPNGLTGDLVYAGDGKFEYLKGKQINGSIVLMDWYSGHQWLTLANLGAKAVIFLPPAYILPPAPMTSPDATKSVPIPLNFPRFYLPEPDASNLLGLLASGGRLQVVIRASTYWEKAKGINVLGLVKGTTYPDKYIMVTSYYDSGSIAPSLALGAQEASGISCLLEFARVLAANPPKYSVLFVAFSAHHRNLGGVSAFAEDGFWPGRNPKIKAIAEHIIMQLNLDISTGSDKVYSVWFGAFYGTPGGAAIGVFDGMNAFFDPISRIWDNIVKGVNQQLPEEEKYTYVPHLGESWPIALTEDAEIFSWNRRIFDIEPLRMFRLPAWAFTTLYDCRPYMGTPFDTLEKVEMSNLKRQFELIYLILEPTLNLDELFNKYIKPLIHPDYGSFVPKYVLAHSSPNPAWYSLNGTVAMWNETTAWYIPVPNALVFVEVASPGRGSGYFQKFVFANENGVFQIYGTYSGMVVTISAWIVDPLTGNLLFSPDLGLHAWAPSQVTSGNPVTNIGFLVVFRCSSMALFNVYSPDTLRAPEVYNQAQAGWIPVQVSIRDHASLTPLTHYATWLYQTSDEVVSALAFPSNETVDVLINAGADRYPLVYLSNSTEGNPLGAGYRLKAGQQLILSLSALRYAEHFYNLNIDRYRTLAQIDQNEFRLSSYRVHLEVGKLIENSYAALAGGDYFTYFKNSTLAWSKARQVYLYIRPKIEDGAYAVPFFALLLLPFVILAEKLIFNIPGLKKTIPYTLLFAVTMIALYLLHPGFSLAESPSMIIIGVSNAILLSPIILIMFNHVKDELNTWRLKLLGKHEIEVTRGAAVLYAFSVGIENMRKRRLRTLLMVITIILTTSAVVGLMSMEALAVYRTLSFSGGYPAYEGIYIHKTKWGYGAYGLGLQIVDYLKGTYGNATVIPRAWKYTDPAYRADASVRAGFGFKLSHDGKTIVARVGLLGLSPGEMNASHPELFFTQQPNLQGRWFMLGDTKVIIISEEQAQTLEIKEVPARVLLEGVPYTVIGVMTKDYALMGDLDGEFVTPIAFAVPVPQNPWDLHVTMNDIFILPFNDVVAMGGDVASISLVLKDRNFIQPIASEVSRKFPSYETYSCIGKSVYLSAAGLSLTVWGLQYQVIVLGIVGLSIFNIMLGSIHERAREISIYSSVGLSPLHITIMFLAEAVTYGLLGSVLGFILAMLMGKLSGAFLPLVVLNYSSRWVIISVTFAIVVTIASSAYPSLKASKLVTPSLERAWKITSKPVGDHWQITLPFTVTSEEETNGIITYYVEFVKAHLGERLPGFSAKDLQFEGGAADGTQYKRLTFETALTPYEAGVRHVTRIEFTQSAERWNMNLLLTKVGGSSGDWLSLNRGFVDILRKQMLIWRSLPDQEKEKYIKEYHEAVEKK